MGQKLHFVALEPPLNVKQVAILTHLRSGFQTCKNVKVTNLKFKLKVTNICHIVLMVLSLVR